MKQIIAHLISKSIVVCKFIIICFHRFKIFFRLTWWIAPDRRRVNKIFEIYEEYGACQITLEDP